MSLEAVPTHVPHVVPFLIISLAAHVGYVLFLRFKKPDIYKIPTVWGPLSLVLGGWLESLFNIYHEPCSLMRGYNKFSKQHKAFRISTIEGWVVIVPRWAVAELQKAPESVMDHLAPIHNAIKAQVTLSEGFIKAPYQFDIIRNQMNSNLRELFTSCAEEVKYAVDQELIAHGFVNSDDEVELNMHDFLSRVVVRLSNSVFLPEFCRHRDLLSSMRHFAEALPWAAAMAAILPRRLVPEQLSRVPYIKSVLLHRNKVETIVQEHLKKRLEHNGLSNGSKVVQWHIEEARKIGGEQTTISELNSRLVILNFASLHPTVGLLMQIFEHLLLDTPSRSYFEVLRCEVDSILSQCGDTWTKDALEKMAQLDRFIKETLRLGGLLTRTVVRLICSPSGYTFGKYSPHEFHLPVDTLVAAPAISIHQDTQIYRKADQFNPQRWLDPKVPNTLSFGAGKHSCPGKRFARLQVMLVTAYLIRNYDLAGIGGRKPKVLTTLGPDICPDTSFTVKIRRRSTTATSAGQPPLSRASASK